jgi:hypothetical protein
MNSELSSFDLDVAADRITDAVIGLGAVGVLMMTIVTVVAG